MKKEALGYNEGQILDGLAIAQLTLSLYEHEIELAAIHRKQRECEQRDSAIRAACATAGA